MNKAIFYVLFVSFLASCTGQSGRMYETLTKAEEMNRNDVLFTSDSMGLALVRYYDRWYRRDANLKLRAYYMLGSAYRDMGEAPAAIHYYNIATEKADTTSSDCDYATLFRVYGQMAMLYGHQNMPQEKKEALNRCSRFAWLSHDTLSYIVIREQLIDVCFLLDDFDGVFANTDSVSKLYSKYGYDRQAKSVYPTAIYVCLMQKDYPSARRYMDIFEGESGLFNEYGDIESGREQYYYSKGLYCIGTNDIDSAEYYFRRLIPYGFLYEAYKGLLTVYKMRENTDSMTKYIDLAELSLEGWMGDQQTNAIIQSSAMYKYERNQTIAAQKAKEAALLYVLLMAVLFLTFVAIVCFVYYRRERKRKMMELFQKYQLSVQELSETEEELATLRETQASDKNLIAQCNDRIAMQEEQIAQLEGTIRKNDRRAKGISLAETEAVKRFERLRSTGRDSEITEKDWTDLRKTVENVYPTFHEHMNARQQLSENEYKVCLLVVAGFEPLDIDTMMHKSASFSSMTRKRLCEKVFGISGKPSDFDQLLRRLY